MSPAQIAQRTPPTRRLFRGPSRKEEWTNIIAADPRQENTMSMRSPLAQRVTLVVAALLVSTGLGAQGRGGRGGATATGGGGDGLAGPPFRSTGTEGNQNVSVP